MAASAYLCPAMKLFAHTFELLCMRHIFLASGARVGLYSPQITSGDTMSAFRYIRSMKTVFSVERQFLGGT